MDFYAMRLPPTAQIGGGSGTQLLSWDPVFGTQGYVVEVGTSSGASNFGTTTLSDTVTSTTITGLQSGTLYYVRVRPIAANGGTGASNAGAASTELTFEAA